MIGNDLVYLPGWPKPKADRLTRFRNKLFTSLEISILHDLPDYGAALLWSVKEAVYKIRYRDRPKAFYAPKAMEIKDVDLGGVEIICECWSAGISYTSKSEILDEYIHTLAIKSSADHRLKDVQISIQKYQHGQTKYLIDSAGNQLAKIGKNKFGIPEFRGNADFQNSILSLSHDGDKMALVWLGHEHSG